MKTKNKIFALVGKLAAVALSGVAAIVLAVALTGCAGAIARDGERVVSVHLPAWPWADTAQTFSRLTASVATNRLTLGISDYAGRAEVNTNLVEAAFRGLGQGLTR